MNEPSQQIDSSMTVVITDDDTLKGNRLYQVAMSRLTNLPSCELIQNKDPRARFQGDPSAHRYIQCTTTNGQRHALLLSAVTFLGGTGKHPLFKKRIQLKEWYKLAFRQLSSQGIKVHFMGVYHYRGNVVFVDWGPETYLANKMHFSSAFVYINDLFQGMSHGVFSRTDLHGHEITTIRGNRLEHFLNSYHPNNSPITTFENFNHVFPFGKWILGIDAIKQLHDEGSHDWKQTEWAGWFLEHLFARQLKHTFDTRVEYHGKSEKSSNTKTRFDFDLWFPQDHFLGDMKASDKNEEWAPGNDKESTLEAICRYLRFWYVIYEHATERDTGSPDDFRIKRQEYLLAVDSALPSLSKRKQTTSTHSCSEDSNPSKHRILKKKVKFERMFILELNQANCKQILADFNQGRQPPRTDGHRDNRAPKLKIDKRNAENFVIYHYEHCV